MNIKKYVQFYYSVQGAQQPTLKFQIEDTARKNLTRLKIGINIWARASAVRPKHRGN